MVGKLLSIGTLMSTLGLLSSVVIQIYGRFFMDSAPSWTEEAARIFFIYTMSFAAGLALRDQEYVQLDILYEKLGKTWKKRLKIIFAICALGLFVVTGIWSVDYLKMGFNEQSSSLGIPMAIPFAGITLMAVAISWYSIQELINIFRAKS